MPGPRPGSQSKAPASRGPGGGGAGRGRGLRGQFEIKWTQRPNTHSLLLKSSAILQNAFARESLITGKVHFCVLVPINPERFKLSNFIHIIITQDSQNSNKMLWALPLRDCEAGGCGGGAGLGSRLDFSCAES